MKKLAIVIMVVLSSITSLAQEVEIETGVDIFSQYIWRGQTVTEDPVAQYWSNIIWGKFTFSPWANMDLTEINNNYGNVNEIDLTADYSDDIPGIPGVGYSIGLIHYIFPNTDFDPTTEIYAGLNFKTFLNPYFKIYRDIDEVDGTYAELGIGHEFKNGLNLDIGYGWGDDSYNRSYWGVPGSGDNVFNIGLSTQREYDNGWATTLSANYIRLLDDKYGDTGNDDLVVGISFIRKCK